MVWIAVLAYSASMELSHICEWGSHSPRAGVRYVHYQLDLHDLDCPSALLCQFWAQLSKAGRRAGSTRMVSLTVLCRFSNPGVFLRYVIVFPLRILVLLCGLTGFFLAYAFAALFLTGATRLRFQQKNLQMLAFFWGMSVCARHRA